jgi:hypothetical protein
MLQEGFIKKVRTTIFGKALGFDALKYEVLFDK